MQSAPSQTRKKASIYDLIRTSAWNRGPDSGQENGHTFLYRPYRTLARRCDEASRGILETMRDEFLALYGLQDEMPSVMPRLDATPEECIAITNTLIDTSPAETLIFEGYAMDSTHEGSNLDWMLVKNVLRRRKQAIYAGGIVCDRWNNKTIFRAMAQNILGEDAVPSGISFDHPDVETVSRWVDAQFSLNEEKVVIKIPGCAGMGNLIVQRNDAAQKQAITDFMQNAPTHAWMLGEVWRPWVKSFCVSFFAPDEKIAPVHMTVCEQVLNASGGFIGGKSFDTLSPRDHIALGAILAPLAITMRHDGMRGFMGFDVVLCEPRRRDRNILPDCGLAVVCIEVNARINGHNQEYLVLDLLARRDGVPMKNLIHLRARNKPVSGATDRAASQRFFTEQLRGLAEPLSPQRIREGVAYFLLDVNHGEKPGVHDAVMFVGSEESAPRIQAAFHALEARGLLLK
jgi:hypothetical protein